MTEKKQRPTNWCAGCQTAPCQLDREFEEENFAMLLQGIIGCSCFGMLMVFFFMLVTSMAAGG